MKTITIFTVALGFFMSGIAQTGPTTPSGVKKGKGWTNAPEVVCAGQTYIFEEQSIWWVRDVLIYDNRVSYTYLTDDPNSTVEVVFASGFGDYDVTVRFCTLRNGCGGTSSLRDQVFKVKDLSNKTPEINLVSGFRCDEGEWNETYTLCTNGLQCADSNNWSIPSGFTLLETSSNGGQCITIKGDDLSQTGTIQLTQSFSGSGVNSLVGTFEIDLAANFVNTQIDLVLCEGEVLSTIPVNNGGVSSFSFLDYTSSVYNASYFSSSPYPSGAQLGYLTVEGLSAGTDVIPFSFTVNECSFESEFNVTVNPLIESDLIEVGMLPWFGEDDCPGWYLYIVYGAELLQGIEIKYDIVEKGLASPNAQISGLLSDFDLSEPLSLLDLKPNTTYTISIELVDACLTEQIQFEVTTFPFDPDCFGDGVDGQDDIPLENRSQVSNIDLDFYPNPAHSVLVLHLTPSQESNQLSSLEGRVQILDAVGRLVLARDVSFDGSGGNAEIDISSLPSGIYSATFVADSHLQYSSNTRLVKL